MKKAIPEIATVPLVFVMIYAAVSKVLDYKSFLMQLSQSPFIYPFAKLAAALIPAAEILTVILLTVNAWRNAGLYVCLFLLCLFTCYLAAMLLFSSYIPCSCGGLIGALSWQAHIVFNCFLLIFNIVAIRFRPNHVPPQSFHV